MRAPNRVQLVKLAKLAEMLSERALAEHAATDAARRLVAERIAGERDRQARAAALPRFDAPEAAPVMAVPARQVEAYLDWSRRRLVEMGTELAAAAAMSETSRIRAARALGRARVLDRLAGDAARLRRPGAPGR